MALIDLVCKNCGYSFEELVKNGQYPACPRCGGETDQNYNGHKSPAFKSGCGSGGCGGSCSSCSGCKN